MKAIFSILSLLLLLLADQAVAQKTKEAKTESIKFSFDSLLLNRSEYKVSFHSLSYEYNYINHSPQKQDHKNYALYKHLIGQQPTEKNHQNYFSLACSLWELKKNADAEKMFLDIVSSFIPSYNYTYYHSSDVAGDTTTNSYGYGSYTSNYKNPACVYLTKIYIEKKDFEKALAYLNKAVDTFPVRYTCGTGHAMQREKYDFLYAACYEGLGQYEKIIEMFLPGSLNRYSSSLTRSLKKTYSQGEINHFLNRAEMTMEFEANTVPSSFLRCTYNSNNKETCDTINYKSGTATIDLFGQKIKIPEPVFIENGDVLTKEKFIAYFKESAFYTSLKEN
jgi:tetratricopeptide (TPR) repeat protein